MDARLKELLEKELLTESEIEEVEEHEEIVEFINNGHSSNKYLAVQHGLLLRQLMMKNLIFIVNTKVR